MASQVYFESGGRGNFYEALDDVAAGQSPATHPAKWGLIELPAFLEEAVVMLAAGYALNSDGQADKGAALRREGRQLLAQLHGRHRPRGDARTLTMPNAQ